MLLLFSACPASSCLIHKRSRPYTGRLLALSSHRRVPATCSVAGDVSVHRECRRRDILQYAAATTSLSLVTWPQAVKAAVSGDDKLRAISITDLRDIVQKDFVQKQYYVTGNLTPQVYTPDCQFKDPTTNVKGVQPYTTAVSKLFDATKSKAEMVSLKVSGYNTLTLKWRLAATLNIPGSPAIKPYTGTTKYVTDDSGLICKHLEEWDISALDAFVSVLFPNFGAPPAPPLSELVSELQT